MCIKYIEQLRFICSEEIYYEEYSTNSAYAYLYSDYEVYKISDADNVYLTLGEINMLGKSCAEELQRIKFIYDELDYLINSEEVFNSDTINEIKRTKDFIKRLYHIRKKYNEDNVIADLDVSAIHMLQREERQNKGLPIEFIKYI